MPLFRRAMKNDGTALMNEGEEAFGDGYVELGPSTSVAAATVTNPTPAPSANRQQDHHQRKQNRFREQFHSFHVMASPYFHENRNGRCLLFIMVILTLLNSAIRVLFSYLARDFWSALYDQNVEQFYSIMAKFVGAMILLAPINVAYRFQRQKLAIAWRKWLTGRVLRLYFSNKVYYGLERQAAGNNTVDRMTEEYDLGEDDATTPSKTATANINALTKMKEVDNPDQRISEDIRSFTEFSLYFFLTLITSAIDLVCFSIILFSIMPQLFLAIFLFAFIGTFLTVCIGKVLIHLNYESLQREADFRFSLVRIRENSESIAFYAGENVEERETDRRFEHVIDNMTLINIAQRNLEFVTTYYNYLTWVLPIMVVAPEFFAGNVELGVISQASSAFGHILDDLSIVVNSFADVSKFSAGIDRLYSFMSAIMELDPERRSMGSLLSVIPIAEISGGISSKNSCGYDTMPLRSTPPSIQMKNFDPWVMTASSFDESSLSRPSTILFIKGLRLATPDNKRILVDNLNLSLETGSHLLIVGASGSGKSSLLRAIAGLWSTGTGEIVRPSSEYVYFLPQRPYCPPGSLRDQLLYPSTDQKDDQFSSSRMDGSEHRPDGGPSPSDQRRLWKIWTDDDLLKLLERVDLPHLAGRSGDGDPYRGLNAVLDWSNTLSLGEQQRLAFGRLIINRPRLVIMDESTSALDVVAERKMYQLLKNTSIGGEEKEGELTYVSVGHRPSLLSYHNLKLSLRDNAGFVSEIPPNVNVVDEGFILS